MGIDLSSAIDLPPRFETLLGAWRSIREERAPTSCDFPFERLLPHHDGLAIVEPIQAETARDYVYRRAGPVFSQRAGIEVEGAGVAEVVHPKTLPRVLEAYDEVMTSGRPHVWECVHQFRSASPTAFVRVLLPLWDGPDGGPVARLLGDWIWRD